jgi:hypothetical protein
LPLRKFDGTFILDGYLDWNSLVEYYVGKFAHKIVARGGEGGDYNCDGVDDQIEINDAISSCPDEGGIIALRSVSGDPFITSGPIINNSKRDVYLFGLGGNNPYRGASSGIHQGPIRIIPDFTGDYAIKWGTGNIDTLYPIGGKLHNIHIDDANLRNVGGIFLNCVGWGIELEGINVSLSNAGAYEALKVYGACYEGSFKHCWFNKATGGSSHDAVVLDPGTYPPWGEQNANFFETTMIRGGGSGYASLDIPRGICEGLIFYGCEIRGDNVADGLHLHTAQHGPVNMIGGWIETCVTGLKCDFASNKPVTLEGTDFYGTITKWSLGSGSNPKLNLVSCLDENANLITRSSLGLSALANCEFITLLGL